MKKLLLLSFTLILTINLSFAQNNSIGKAPNINKKQTQTKTNINLNGQTLGYGGDGINGNWYSVDIPGGVTTILGTQEFFMQGADFAGDTFYAINGDTDELVTIDITNGNSSVVAPITGVSVGQTITALGYDESSGIMFMGTTNMTESELYTVDLSTGNASLIGTIGQPGLIALLVNCEGEVWSVDIVDDQLWSIDPVTGAGSPVGLLGFDANFAQDADINSITGFGYLTAFNNNTLSAELREVDFATGNTTLIIDLAGAQLTGFGINEVCGPPCPVDDPSNPDPPNGATNVPVDGVVLNWTNAPEADEITVYFGFAGSISEIYSGPPITSLNLPPLDYGVTWRWRVDQIDLDEGCTNYGPYWSFTTISDPTMFYWLDNFSNGTINWNITNDGGDCDWELHQANEYEMPLEAEGNVLAADAEDCGIGTTIFTTATINTSLDLSNFNTVFVHFDNDLNILNENSEAHLEISLDDGNHWVGIWDKVGVSVRNSQEFVELNGIAGCSEFKLRLRAEFPDGEGWWAIDNFIVVGAFALSLPYQPMNLTADFMNVNPPYVELNWEYAQPVINGFEIERKPADSSFAYFVKIDSITGFTETYTDNTVEINSSYTYRIRAFGQGIPPEGLVYSCYSNWSDVDTDVPVELVSFIANIVDNKVNLNWKTATETNNQGFEIERKESEDGSQNSEWSTIGFVDGKGTTSEEQAYTFVDDEQLFGKYQYRLKQIDYDGSYEYSNAVEIDLGMPKEFSLEQNYPNPFNPTTIIKFTIPETRLRSPLEEGLPAGRQGQRGVSTKLIVYDILGNEITTLVNEEKQPGIHEVEFDASNLSSGIYFYRLQAVDPSTGSGQSFISTKKMIYLK